MFALFVFQILVPFSFYIFLLDLISVISVVLMSQLRLVIYFTFCILLYLGAVLCSHFVLALLYSTISSTYFFVVICWILIKIFDLIYTSKRWLSTYKRLCVASVELVPLGSLFISFSLSRLLELVSVCRLPKFRAHWRQICETMDFLLLDRQTFHLYETLESDPLLTEHFPSGLVEQRHFHHKVLPLDLKC